MTEPREFEDSGRMRYGGAVLRDPDELADGALVHGGAYRVEHVLGRGGMAVVYAAHRQSDGARVALKVIREKFARRADVEYRLHNEVDLAGELSGHPNVVRTLEAGRLAEARGVPFVVTERVEGPPLTAVVIQLPYLPTARACRIALDLAHALEALHARGIVHRDVKPDNVILVNEGTGDEVAKLIDFGLATRMRAAPGRGEGAGVAGSLTAVQAERVTKVFERPGTRHYMAPEQAAGEAASPAMDVYALGCTLYEMLLGAPPLGHRSEDEVVARKLAADQPGLSIAGERKDLPAALVRLVDGCLAREPGKRIGVGVLAAGLQRVLRDLEAVGEPSVDAASINAATATERVPVAEVLASASAVAIETASPTDVDATAPAADDATRVDEVDAVAEAARTGMTVIVAAPRVDPALLVGPTRAEVLTRLARLENPDSLRSGDQDLSATRAPAGGSTSRAWVPWAIGGVLIAGVVAVLAWPESPRAIEPTVTATEPAPAVPAKGQPSRPSKSVGPSEATPVAAASVGVQPAAPEPVPPAEPEVPTPAVPSPAVPSSMNDGGGEAGDVPATEPATPKPVPKPKPKPVPAAEPPAVDPAICDAERRDAQAAANRRAWSEVLTHTAPRKCWPDKDARRELRVRAMAGLHRWNDCIDEAGQSTNAVLQPIVTLCRKRAEP